MPSFGCYRNISHYDEHGRQLDYVDQDTARYLCSTGSEWRCVSCGKMRGEGPCLVAKNHLMAVFEVPEVVETDDSKKARNDSDCSLTLFDMQCNVGITEGADGCPPIVAQIRRAQERIENWRLASLHNKALTVVPHTRKHSTHSRPHKH